MRQGGSETATASTVSRLLMFKYYCMQYTDDAVVLRMATSVVQVVGVKTAVILPVPKVHSNQAQIH